MIAESSFLFLQTFKMQRILLIQAWYYEQLGQGRGLKSIGNSKRAQGDN